MEGLSRYTFFKSFHEALEDFNDETYGKCVRMLSDYVFNGIEPAPKGEMKMFWVIVKPLLDAALKKSEAGRLGGLKNGENKADTKQPESNPKADVKQLKSKMEADTKQPESNPKTILEQTPSNMKMKEKVKGEAEGEGEVKKEDVCVGEKQKTRRFSPPSIDEVEAYCRERGNNIVGEKFVDFYASKGWKVGNTPMKDWKAAVRTWEQRDGFKGKGGSKNPSPKVKLGVGEFIAADGTRRYGTGNLPPVPMDAPPRPDNDSVWSAETKSWIPSGL